MSGVGMALGQSGGNSSRRAISESTDSRKASGGVGWVRSGKHITVVCKEMSHSKS